MINDEIQEAIDEACWMIRRHNTEWSRLGNVRVVRGEGDLLLFTYSPECQFKKPDEWTPFERAARGLVLDERLGTVVARPFPKFWNLGEVEPPDTGIESVTTKMDGSLGIMFRHDGEWRVVTRGSFESDQANWATRFISNHYTRFANLPNLTTYLFEIIYPENRIVIDYGNRADMVLLAAINRDGEEASYSALSGIATSYGLSCVDNIAANDIEEVERLVAALGPNEEGFVVRYEDGTRLKLKGAEYVQIHRFLNQFNEKAVAEAMIEDRLDDLKAACPVSKRAELNEMVSQVTKAGMDGLAKVYIAYDNCLDAVSEDVTTREGRKQFAALVMGRYRDLSSHLFAKLDNRFSYKDIIRAEFLK